MVDVHLDLLLLRDGQKVVHSDQMVEGMDDCGQIVLSDIARVDGELVLFKLDEVLDDDENVWTLWQTEQVTQSARDLVVSQHHLRQSQKLRLSASSEQCTDV